MTNLNEKTTLPLGWVITGIISMVTLTATATFWVASVNYRLGRIESRLGIPVLSVKVPIVQEAEASE